MKKIFSVVLSGALILSPLISWAAGIVPCGEEGEPACQFCHFFVLFKNIVDFILIKIVPPIAVLMLAFAGFMFFFGGQKPEILAQAKSTIKATIIGLIIIYGAWVLVNTFFQVIGVSEWTGLKEGWWQIKCP